MIDCIDKSWLQHFLWTDPSWWIPAESWDLLFIIAHKETKHVESTETKLNV